MTQALTVPAGGALAIESHWTPEQVNLIRRMVAPDASPDEFKVFLYHAWKSGLDPLAKQIYCIVRGQGERRHATHQIGIDGARLVADRTERYAGSDRYLFDEGLTDYEHGQSGRGDHPDTASVTVWKLVGSLRVPFTASVRWAEYVAASGTDSQWRQRPYHMLGKCAEMGALRKAFPIELSALYVREELEAQGVAAAVVSARLPGERSLPPPSRRGEPVPRPERRAQGASGQAETGELIADANDPRWGYWMLLCGAANLAGLRIPILALPVTVSQLTSAAASLKRGILERGGSVPSGDPTEQASLTIEGEGYSSGEEGSDEQ